MKRLTKAMAAIAAAVLMPAPASAQDEIETTVQADFVTGYIWRGQDLGSSAVQPTLGVAWKGISLTAWGSYQIPSSVQDGNSCRTKEIDLTLAYSNSGFNVGITDYYCLANCVDGEEPRYFLYGSGARTTAHTFEANIGYDFGFLSVQWYTNFAGLDSRTADKRDYTSYFEISAPFKLAGIDWKATLGAVPYNCAGDGFYADTNSKGFAVTNVSLGATKDIKITDKFSLPIFANLIANPSTQKLFFTAGFSLGI